MQDYRKLRVWQNAHQLAINTYALPAYLLKPEAWPLRDQILRAAISIPSNIAEGVHSRLGKEVSVVRQMLTRFIQTVN